MMDKTWTICGQNGPKSDLVRNESFINTIIITHCEQYISSTNSLKHYFVHKNDGVSFGKLSSDGVIRFGCNHILKIFPTLQKFFMKFLPKTTAIIEKAGEFLCLIRHVPVM
jgi:hypothetical protein